MARNVDEAQIFKFDELRTMVFFFLYRAELSTLRPTPNLEDQVLKDSFLALERAIGNAKLIINEGKTNIYFVEKEKFLLISSKSTHIGSKMLKSLLSWELRLNTKMKSALRSGREFLPPIAAYMV